MPSTGQAKTPAWEAADNPGSRMPIVVAVINSNQDVIRLIDETLEDEGYTVATEHVVSLKDGVTNLAQFLTNHQPALIVFDLSPPYLQNWNFLQLLRKIPMVERIPIVLTTVNKVALEKTVGKTTAFELVGTRDNLVPVIEKINRLIRRTNAQRAAADAVVGLR